MRFRFLIATTLALAACSAGPDDEFRGGDVDAAAGPACTSAVYDPCTSNTDCASANCHLFSQSGFQVCTTACTPLDNTTCPVDSSGVVGQCNQKGLCKPAVQNSCTR